MLFLFLMTFNVASAIYFGVNLPYHWTISVLLSILLYFVISFFTYGIMFLLLLWLGKTDKLVLKKKRRYWVRYRDDSVTEVVMPDSSGLVIDNSSFAETRFDTKELCPYVVFEHYNIGGWRRFFLPELYKDTIKIILYLPSEDEV